MTTDELIEHLLNAINRSPWSDDWPPATRIDGEDAIGIEAPDGELFFLTVVPA